MASVAKNSFADIMSQQMAQKIQRDEAERLRRQAEEDFLLALQLSEEQYVLEYGDIPASEQAAAEQEREQTRAQEQQAETQPPQIEDKDYLAALQLQAQFDAEYREQQFNSLSKVSVMSSDIVPAAFRATADQQDESDSEQSNEEDEDEEELARLRAMAAPGRSRKKATITKHDPVLSSRKNIKRMQNDMVALGNLSTKTTISTPVFNALHEKNRRIANTRVREKERSDHSTQDQVLDEKTRIRLLKLINADVLESVNGVVSTGKEAKVFHAVGKEIQGDVAIKIYKTTLNEFRDREKYFEGEHRFSDSNKGRTSNTRKLVRLWAEKEFKNLIALQRARIPCPAPYVLRENCLLMQFIGSDGWPAPQLKNAKLSENALSQAYHSVVTQMRTLYQQCKLVHADLSEYNILYFDKVCFFIDVSQAVSWDHPNALFFLRKDCTNMIEFFRRRGTPTMGVRQLFNFVTDAEINDDNIDQYLEEVHRLAREREANETPEDEIEEEVFKRCFIPRTLSQVTDPTAEVEAAQQGTVRDVFHQSVTGFQLNLRAPSSEPVVL